MVRGQASIMVAARPQRLYEFITDDFVRNYQRWSPEVISLELLTPGPLQVGSQARQVRVDQGRRSESIFRVVTLEPPNRVEFAERANKFSADYRIDPAGDHTNLMFVFELKRLEFYMLPFEKLIRITIQDGAKRVVSNIKQLVESELEQRATEQR